MQHLLFMRVGRIVDLSQPIRAGMPVYPGDPAPSLTEAAGFERDGFHVQHVRIGSHTGTHVDAPYHVEPTGPQLDELDPRLFVGPGVLVDLTDLAPRMPIGWSALAPHAARLGPGTIVLLHTGRSGVLDHPFLAVDACRRLLDLGVRTVCTDALNIDPSPTPGRPTGGLPVHHLIARAGGVVGENFCNLAGIDFADPLISCLPIALAGGDGAPTRAVALELLP